MAAMASGAGDHDAPSSPRSRSASPPPTDSADSGSDSPAATGRVSCRLPRPRLKSGSIGYLASSASLPQGPHTAFEFSQWPISVVRKLFGDNTSAAFLRACRFEALVRSGHMLHTDFSGQGCVEQGYKMIGVACKHTRLTGVDLTLPDPWTKSYRSCDNNRTCQSILVSLDSEHVFTDVSSRVPPALRDGLHSMRPVGRPPRELARNDTKWKVEAARKHKRMEVFLAAHGAASFGPGCTSDGCLKHPGSQCMLSFAAEGAPPGKIPLRTCVAGSMCTPWSSFGSKDGAAHPACESHQIWAQDMRHSEFDLVTLENSEYFPLDTWMAKLSDKFLVVHICVCPSMLGWPARRMRMYATAINLERLVWLGPSPQEPQSISDDFLGLFGARVCAEADIFAHVDTAESMQKYHRSLANLRGIFSGSHSTLDLLPPDAQRRLQGYMDLVEDSRGLGGSCVADLSQNPAKRPRIGPWFGACTRSSMFISLTAGASDSSASAAAGPYLFSPAEISFANGWPSIPVHGPNSAPSVFTDTYPEALKGLGGATIGGALRQRHALAHHHSVVDVCEEPLRHPEVPLDVEPHGRRALGVKRR